MCICKCVDMYMLVCIYICVCIYIYLYLYNIRECVCVCIYVCMGVYICVILYIYMSLSIYVNVCVYIYIYIYMGIRWALPQSRGLSVLMGVCFARLRALVWDHLLAPFWRIFLLDSMNDVCLIGFLSPLSIYGMWMIILFPSNLVTMPWNF